MTGSSSSSDGDFGEWKVAALRKVMSVLTSGRHGTESVEDEGWSEELVGDVAFKARRRGWTWVEAI